MTVIHTGESRGWWRPASARFLVAPDSFKGTYRAPRVAAAIARGIGGDVDLCPLADGGEGTTEVLVEAMGGTISRLRSRDPIGRPITASLGWIDDRKTAVVDAAAASGLNLVAPDARDAEAASSTGTGELIASAVAAGARRLVLGVGGTGSTDGGAGAVEAIERAGGLAGAELLVLCDVTTPFERAASTYAPQKGADPAAVGRLTARLEAYAGRLPRDPRGVPMTGAGGGMAGGLWGHYGATLTRGASWILDAVGFNARLAGADAVITGEGRLDPQTLEGKLVGEVAARCRAAQNPVHVIAGSIELGEAESAALGVASTQVATSESEMELAGRRLAQIPDETGPERLGAAG